MSGRFEIDMSASCHIEHKASANDACWMFLREWRREAQGVARSPGVSQAPKSLPCSTRASQIRYAADRAREEAREKTILGQINDVCHADRGPASAAPAASNSRSAPSSNTALNKAKFESRMSYLQGNSSQYLCGSSSFCD